MIHVERNQSLIIGVGCCLLLAAILSNRAVRVAYHKHAFESAHKAIYSKPSVVGEFLAYGDQATFDRYEYHRNKLVVLGYLTHKHFELRHLGVPTEESKHFSRALVEGRCPSHIDFSSPYPETLEPMQLDVWCLPDHAKQWEAFVASHDVSDYHARYMADEPASTPDE